MTIYILPEPSSQVTKTQFFLINYSFDLISAGIRHGQDSLDSDQTSKIRWQSVQGKRFNRSLFLCNCLNFIYFSCS
jgi:hypothetical protein